MRISTRVLVALYLAFSFSAVAVAGPFEDGDKAYNKGDYAAALRLFKDAAAQGNASAELHLGSMYYNGDGVTKDTAEALRWFQLSAAKGNRIAQYSLGLMYETGDGVTANVTDALHWYSLAAKQGEVGSIDAVKRLTKGK
jgi:hypothetical protein